MMAGNLLRISIFILASLLWHVASAQQPAPVTDTIITDTVAKEVLNPLRQRVADEIRKNIKQLNADKITARQNRILNNILKVSQKANDYLEKGIDTAGIASRLDYVLRLYDVAGDGIFTNKGSTQTEVNLATSSTLLKELLNTTEIGQHALDLQLKDLVGFQNNIDSLASDSILIELPSDSVSLINLISKITLVTKEMRPADTLIKKAIQKVQLLQAKVNFVTIKLEDGIEKMEHYREDLSSSLSDRETNNIWDPIAFRRPMGEIYSMSEEKAKLVFSYYSGNNTGGIVFVLIFIAVLALFLRNLKKRTPADRSLPAGQPGWLVLRFPLLSSVFIGLVVFQFIFPSPPFVFNMLLWVISVLALTLIFNGFITKYWKSAWLILVVMFFLAVVDNLVLQASRVERYGMLLLSLTGASLGIVFLMSSHRKELKERGVRIFIGFFIFIESIAAVANLYGRYNIAKSFMTSGIFGLVNAILFFWAVRLINEMLGISSGVYKMPGKKTSLFDPEKTGRKVPLAFYFLLAIGWGILFGRSFYFFSKLTEQFTAYMAKERTIGEYTFTIQNISVFFVILFLSGLVSNLVVFFSSGNRTVASGPGKKTGIGSWLLLIRISIISIGVLLAFAAAGIPMDRLAIILGALSVGIGFGLQSLVNNLVSGLILAFEKPINVGDVVEFGGQTGTMKSIGFRSSIITTWDGADVIIPNGNLLSEQLINWTMGNSNRRVEIAASVPYGTDLAKTKELLIGLMDADKRIIPYPPPSVLIKDLNSGMIEIRVLFWIEAFDTWMQIRSDMVEAIDEAFKKQGILVPNV
ncbi:MAG TPA: mechanosensitive ion channel domain-containing protein [Puia sp.]|nr:mechanosensitive ion channel domain-containing protein [Puia sp.]